MSLFLLSLGSVLGVSALSLIGVMFLRLPQEHLRPLLLILISFSTGALLGDVFLHMIPEMAEGRAWLLSSSFFVLAGLLLSFAIEKFIHWRHCHEGVCTYHVHPIGWMNIIGDGIHNFLDGILIAGSFLVSPTLGWATTLAVVVHEIPQEFSDFGVLLYSGFSRKRALLFNFFSALMAVLGVMLVFVAIAPIPSLSLFLLPFAAGNLLYIASADFIPELHKETGVGRSLVQFIGILCGIALMALLTLMA